MAISFLAFSIGDSVLFHFFHVQNPFTSGKDCLFLFVFMFLP